MSTGYRSTQRGHTSTLKEDTAVFDKDISWHSRRMTENAPLKDDAGVLHTQNEKNGAQGYSTPNHDNKILK